MYHWKNSSKLLDLISLQDLDFFTIEPTILKLGEDIKVKSQKAHSKLLQECSKVKKRYSPLNLQKIKKIKQIWIKT